MSLEVVFPKKWFSKSALASSDLTLEAFEPFLFWMLCFLVPIQFFVVSKALAGAPRNGAFAGQTVGLGMLVEFMVFREYFATWWTPEARSEWLWNELGSKLWGLWVIRVWWLEWMTGILGGEKRGRIRSFSSRGLNVKILLGTSIWRFSEKGQTRIKIPSVQQEWVNVCK